MPLHFDSAAAIPWPSDTRHYVPEDDPDQGPESNLLLGGSPTESALTGLLLDDDEPDSGTGGAGSADYYGATWNDLGPWFNWDGSSQAFAPTVGSSVDWAGATSSTPRTDNTTGPSQVGDPPQYNSGVNSNFFLQYPTISDDHEPVLPEVDAGYDYYPGDSGDTAASVQDVAYIVKREHPRVTRRNWERYYDLDWPKEPSGRNFDVSHKQALGDEGTNDPWNVEPKQHDEHVREHVEN